MNTTKIETTLKKNMQALSEEYSVTAVYLFGSYARNTQTRKSDIDLLVEFKEPIGLFAFVGLKTRLESLLKKKIDLVTRDAIKVYMKDKIEKDLIRVA